MRNQNTPRLQKVLLQILAFIALAVGLVGCAGGSHRQQSSSPAEKNLFIEGRSTTVGPLRILPAYSVSRASGRYDEFFRKHGQIIVYLRTKQRDIYENVVAALIEAYPGLRSIGPNVIDPNNAIVLLVETDGKRAGSDLTTYFGGGLDIRYTDTIAEARPSIANSIAQRQVLLTLIDIQVAVKEAERDQLNEEIQRVDREIAARRRALCMRGQTQYCG